MRIVLDINVLISALIKKGRARELLITIIRNGHDIVISKEMLEEFLRVTNDPVIRRYVGDRDISRFVRDIGSVAKVVKIRVRVRAVKKRDPSDDIILGTSYNGRARFVVSGDRDLGIGGYRRANIITVDEIRGTLEEDGER